MRANLLTMLAICLFVAGASLGLSTYRSLHERLVSTAPAENIVIMSQGAASERGSRLGLESARKVELLDGLRRDGDTALAARELVGSVFVNSSDVRFQMPVIIRGTDEHSAKVHGITLVAGTAPEPGSLQVMVGRRIAEKNPEIKIGSALSLPGGKAPVTGIYSASASPYEDEVWTPRAALEIHLKTSYASSVTVVANSSSQVPSLIDSINTNKDLKAQATALTTLRAKGAGMATILRVVLVLLVLLSLVATVAIATTMNAAVMTRMPELAAMVAIGIRRSVLGRMILVESLLLALLGAVLGVGLGQLIRLQLGTIQLGDTPVKLSADPLVLVVGLALAAIVGIIGSIAPSLMVRRLDVIANMR
jgi:putative ABC transport system permease protein